MGNNQQSVEGILKKHLTYTSGQRQNIIAAMQEYASLLVNKTALDYLLELEKQRDHYKALAEAAAYLMSPSAAKDFPVAFNKYWQLKQALKTQTPDREQK